MKIKFLGATETVTGSKFEIEHRGTKVLIDCGLFQGPKEFRQLNWSESLLDIDYKAVILTHAHIDHSGYLPKLVQKGFKRKIFSTPATFELSKILLADSAKLQVEDAEFANKTKHSRHFPALPLYDLEDVKQTINLFEERPYNIWSKIDDEISFQFIRNGHILGSSIVQIQYNENNASRILTFSGDLGSGRSHVIKDPEQIVFTDYLVTESTYGDRVLNDFNENELAELINKVYKRQGTLIIPTFAVGRTQEILFLLKKLQNEQKISQRIPIYLDSPMATNASSVYTKFHDELKLSSEFPIAEMFFQPVNFRICESADESMLLCMSDQPKIILSSSGMLQGGRVLHHLKMKLPNEKNAVLFTGYQGQGTKGLLLKNGFKKIRIHHQEIDVEAEIVTLDSLSAHADTNELISYYKKFQKPPINTFIVHGEPNAQATLKYRFENELKWKATIPKLNDVFELKD